MTSTSKAEVFDIYGYRFSIRGTPGRAVEDIPRDFAFFAVYPSKRGLPRERAALHRLIVPFWRCCRWAAARALWGFTCCSILKNTFCSMIRPLWIE